jgi:hypothetical protein
MISVRFPNFGATMTKLTIGAMTFLCVSLSACMPAVLHPRMSKGGTSMAGAWNDGGDLRPQTFGRSPAPPQHPPQIAAVPGMPAAGVAPYRPRISTFVSGMLVYSLMCLAPDGPLTAAPGSKAPISKEKSSPQDDQTDLIPPLECNQPSHHW